MEYKTEKSKINERPKSANAYSDKCPTFVVAFSLKETYDDLVTAQQIIRNKYSPQDRSPEDSIISITPTNSIKMIESDTPQPSTINLEHSKEAEDKAIEKENSEEIIENECLNIVPNNSLKYLNESVEEIENILEYSLTEKYQINNEEVGNASLYKEEKNQELISSEPEQRTDSKENVPITNNVLNKYVSEWNKASENCITVQNKSEDINAPEILFNATTYNKKSKESKFLKRKVKNHRNVNIKNVHFKYKNTKNSIHSRLDSYYNKNKKSPVHSGQIHKDLCSKSISTIVSRTRVLKNVLAKENLLEETELLYSSAVNTYDSSKASIASFPFVAQKSLSRNNSEKNLINIKSSKTNETYTLETTNAAIEIPTKKIYKSDVINVAIAVAYKTSKGKGVCLTNKKNLSTELVSNETLMPDVGPITSSLPTSDMTEISNETLVNTKSSFDVSSNETFFIAKNSSEFTKGEIDTNPKPNDSYQIRNNQRSFLDTVINLGIYSDTSPSTSSAGYEIDADNVIVTGLNKSYPINTKLGLNFNRDVNSESILKKSNLRAGSIGNRNLNLPKQAEIKAMIKENEMSQRKCAEEARLPTSVPEMWERLVCVLDLAVKRLEDTLSEKIIKELKKSLTNFEINSNNRRENFKDVEMMSGDITVLHKEVDTREGKNETEQGMQCDLVNNKVIDDLMLKLSSEGPKIMTPVTTKSFSKVKSSVIKDLFEVLKPPHAPIVIDKGDNITVSTLSRASEYHKFERLKVALQPPLNFLRENVIVLTGVPSFFFALLCFYGVILLIIKPW